MNFTAPEMIATHHGIAGFSCGNTSLDDWLKKRALANQSSGATRTFVAKEKESDVLLVGNAADSVKKHGAIDPKYQLVR
jgi:hypothetical protein